MSNYQAQAKDDAVETASNFLKTIAEQMIETGIAGEDLFNDYSDGDSWHHECHVDKFYTLLEAAELLDELEYCEESDWGLWEGQEPRKAIETQAAFTYGNAVIFEWTDLINRLNDGYTEWSDSWETEEEKRLEDASDPEREAAENDHDTRKTADLESALVHWIKL